MAENSSIEWTHHTFNPWWGCTKVSPACGLPMKGHEGEPHGCCYADTFSNRLGFKIWGQDATRRFFGEAHWNEPEKWDRKAKKDGVRRRVFCGSMCDVMEERDDLIEPRTLLYDLIVQTPWLDWLLLTKRPQNFRRFLPAGWIENPVPNVWLMTTVESAEYLWRIDSLKACPAVIHGLSIEPLLGPLPTLGEYLDGIDFAIVGGESGHGARPMPPEWVRSVRDQCLNVGSEFFFKQWGEWSPTGLAKTHAYRDVSCGDGSHHRMFRVGKETAGRLFDGHEWNDLP